MAAVVAGFPAASDRIAAGGRKLGTVTITADRHRLQRIPLRPVHPAQTGYGGRPGSRPQRPGRGRIRPGCASCPPGRQRYARLHRIPLRFHTPTDRTAPPPAGYPRHDAKAIGVLRLYDADGALRRVGEDASYWPLSTPGPTTTTDRPPCARSRPSGRARA